MEPASKITKEQKDLQQAVEEMQGLQKETQKLAQTIAKYDAQLQENEVGVCVIAFYSVAEDIEPFPRIVFISYSPLKFLTCLLDQIRW